MIYPRKLLTRPVTREEAMLLAGSVQIDGKVLTVDEIMADPTLEKVTHARDIFTGKMKRSDELANNTKLPFFVVRASRD